jgi:hypothetical protein
LCSAFKIIELLIQRTGQSISKFGLSEAHNFCKAVQLSLLPADTKQLSLLTADTKQLSLLAADTKQLSLLPADTKQLSLLAADTKQLNNNAS